MIEYGDVWAQSEGARQGEIDRARGEFRRAVAAYNAEPPTGKPELLPFLMGAERTRDAAIEDATRQHNNRLAVAAAALDVPRVDFGLPGDSSDPDARAWCAARGIEL